MAAREAKQLYCLCRRSDDSGFMIACDQCDEWFHGACVGLTAAQGKRIGKYTCPLCDDGLHSQIVSASRKPDNAAASSGANKKRPRDEAKEKEEKEAAESAAAQANVLRSLVRNTLAEALFVSYRVDEEHTHPDEVARVIEAELVKTYGLASKEYKARYRSLLSNLKDARNSELRKRTLSGELRPDELCRMRSEDLAPKELAALRKQREEAYLKEVVIKSGDAAPEALPALKFAAPLQKDDSIASFIQRARKLEDDPALTQSTPAPSDAGTAATSETKAQHEGASLGTSADMSKDEKRAEDAIVSDREEGGPAEEAAAAVAESPAAKRRREEEEEERERQREVEREREKERRREEKRREKEAPLMEAKRSAVLDRILEDVDVSRLSSSLSAAPLVPLAPSALVPPGSAPAPAPAAPSAASIQPAAPVPVPVAAPKRAEEVVLWRGSLTNLGTPTFTAAALAVPASGAVADAARLPAALTVVGRMDLKALLKYLNELERSSTRRRSAFLLDPAADADAPAHATLYEFLKSRNRGGVVQVPAGADALLKELFVVPVAHTSTLPPFLSLARPRRTDMLWLVQVLAMTAVTPVSPPGPLSRSLAPSPAPLGLSVSSTSAAALSMRVPAATNPAAAVDAFLSKLVAGGAAPPPPASAAMSGLPPGFQALLAAPTGAPPPAAAPAFPAVPLPSHAPPAGHYPFYGHDAPPPHFTGFSHAPPPSSGFSPPPGFTPYGAMPPQYGAPPPQFHNGPPPPHHQSNWSSGPPPAQQQQGGGNKPRWDRR